MKITDKNGYEWTDSFNITVISEDINLSYYSHVLSNYSRPVMLVGDTRTLDVTIQNKGISLAHNVTISISSDYPYIHFTRNEVSCNDIDGGKNKTANNSFIFEATTEFVSDTVIPMQITITDSKGNLFTETFNIN